MLVDCLDDFVPNWGSIVFKSFNSIFTQKTAHRLCDRYFDVTKGFRDDQRSNPVGYGIIVEKVCPSHLHFFGIISIY